MVDLPDGVEWPREEYEPPTYEQRTREYLDMLLPQVNMSITPFEARDMIAMWYARKPLHAVDGGCWFCSRDGAKAFCYSWDTNYHTECLALERVHRPGNPELDSWDS